MRALHVRVVSLIGVIQLAAVGVILIPSARAGSAPCQADNLTSGAAASSDLQAVIDAASPGDVIEISGTCSGGFTIGKDVTIRSASEDHATLDGGHINRVLTVIGTPGEPIDVTLKGLHITAGLSKKQSGYGGDGGAIFSRMSRLQLIDSVVSDSMASGDLCDGGGIYAKGTLTLTSTTVTRNRAYRGGGVFVRRLTMEGQSVVSRNSAKGYGGGIWSWGLNRLEGRSEIAFNTALAGGGLHNNGESRYAAIRMEGSSSIHDNVAVREGGGGVHSDASLMMKDHATVIGNVALGGSGGGIHLQYGSVLQLNEQSSVTGNVAQGRGGGIALELADARLRGAASVFKNIARKGGGIYSFGGVYGYGGHVTLQDRTSVTRNTAGLTGGGVYAQMTRVSVEDRATIVHNSPNDIVKKH